MNKKLLALSLIAAPGLMAQEAAENNMANEQSGYCNTCGCNTCCCKPCCVPKPKKCIDCECYTPQFYDLQCDCGFFFDVEFLYWYAGETDLAYALKVQNVSRTDDANIADPIGVFAPQSYRSIDTGWDPGFRLGIGWNQECDGWDWYLNWTYMHNSQKESSSVPADYNFDGEFFVGGANQEFLINPWINQSFHFAGTGSILTFDRISAKWRTTVNWIDLELGRKYWLSRCFNLRPFAALRGLWTRTNFRTNSSRNFTEGNTTTSASFRDRFKSSMWGVGFVGGIQPTWYFCDNFAFYSNMDVALLWGGFDVKKRENYVTVENANGAITTDPNYSNSSTNKFSQMTAMFDVGIGLRWEEYWCCDQYRSNLDIGWEHHILLDQNHRNKSYDLFSDSSTPLEVNGFRQFGEATGNLGLGGLVIRVRFDW